MNNASPKSPNRAQSPLRRDIVTKVSESEEVKDLTVKNVESEYLRGQIIVKHRIQTVVAFERKDVAELRLKEQGHQDQLEDIIEYEQNQFQNAIDEDKARHEAFIKLLENSNDRLEEEIQHFMQELEKIRGEREEQRRVF